MGFQFTPSNGLLNTTTFPTTPVNENAARQQPQTLFDQIKDEMNSGATSAIGLQSLARQAIINGNFDVWQRGTSFTNPVNGSYIADRFLYDLSNSGTLPTTIIHSRNTLTSGDIPNAYYNYRINVNGAGSGFGVNDYYRFQQRIENGTRYLCGNGKKVTVSFWAKSDIAGKKLGCFTAQFYGTGGSPSAIETLVGNTFTLTSTWTKYTITFTTNTLVGKTFGTNNDDILYVYFPIMWGGTWSSTRINTSTAESFVGSGNIDIAQVQLCVGDQALPFQPRSFADELALCQRYYEPLDFNASSPMFRFLTNQIWVRYPFKVAKRIIPTLSNATDLSTTFGTGSKQIQLFRYSDNATITATGNVTITGDATPYTTMNVGAYRINATTLSNSSGDAVYLLQTVKDTNIGWDAEL